MLLLRIKDVPAISEVGRSAPHGIDEARRRIEMTWQEGRRLSKVVSSFIYEIEERDAERIRWYLEDYGVFPADPAPRLAAEAEACIENIGSDLFRLVFSDSDAAKIWALAQRDLGQVRVEVDADQAGSSGLPWELLRDPNTGINTALEAAAFVRTHIPAGSQG